MKTNKQYTIFICLLFTVMSESLAQNYRITKYGIENGLLSNDIYNLAQDSNGYLWMSSYAGFISKFDGREFNNYKFTSSPKAAIYGIPTGLNINPDGNISIEGIIFNPKTNLFSQNNYDTIYDYEIHISGKDTSYGSSHGQADRYGNIWKCDFSGRLYRFFNNANYLIDENDGIIPDSIGYNASRATGKRKFPWFTLLDNNKNFYARAKTGFYRFDGKKFVFLPINHGKSIAIFEDNQKKLWMISGSIPDEIICFDKGKTIVYPKSIHSAHQLSGHAIQDSKENIWFESSAGLLKFNGNSFRLYSDLKGYRLETSDNEGNLLLSNEHSNTLYIYNGLSLKAIFNEKGTSDYTRRGNILTDRENNIWITTAKGLYRISKSNVISKPLSSFYGYKEKYQDWKLLFISKSYGALYYIRNQGIFKIENDSLKPLLRDSLIYPREVAEEKNGDLWISVDNTAHYTYHGIYRYTEKGIFAFKSKTINELQSKGKLPPCDLLIDEAGVLNMIFSKSVLSLENGEFKRYALNEDTLIKNSGKEIKYSYSIPDVNKKEILFSVRGIDWLVRFNTVKKKFEIASRKGDISEQPFPPSLYRSFYKKGSKYYCLFNGKGGIDVFDYSSKTFLKDTFLLIPNLGLPDFLLHNNTMWFHNTLGLGGFAFDSNDKLNVVSFTIADGLSSDNINQFIIDRKNFMWACTDLGVDKINLTEFYKTGKKSIMHYGYEEGIHDISTYNIFSDTGGIINIISNSEYIKINPNLVIKNKIAPIVGITNFQWTLNDSIYKDTIIPYGFNPLTISFVGTCLTNGAKVRYKYLLEGLDKDWQEQVERIVKYTSLPSGNYTFKLVACNNDGVWSNDPTTISFTILPPWWRTWWFYLLTLIVLVGGIFAFINWRTHKLKIEKKQLEEVVAERTQEVLVQKHIIEEKNKDIIDSINYAKRIQRAMLPHRKDIWTAFPQSFVLFKPKDIVSGDFYFFHQNGQSKFIASADCTGHGVPGAFMSMVGAEKLNDAVSKSLDISEILSLLNKGVKSALKQSEADESATRDGMDIALCSVDTDARVVKYAGANRPIWIIRNGQTSVEEIKATKKAIGGFTEDSQHFDSHEIKFEAGDTFYIHTDGFADTFGGTEAKKVTTKRFKEILLSIQDKTMKEQEKHLDSFIENWKGGTEQIDDILVIGVRL